MPQAQPTVERKLLMAMLAARLKASLNAMKQEMGAFVKAQDFPNVLEAKRAFWDMMTEALVLIRDEDLVKATKPQPKGGKG